MTLHTVWQPLLSISPRADELSEASLWFPCSCATYILNSTFDDTKSYCLNMDADATYMEGMCFHGELWTGRGSTVSAGTHQNVMLKFKSVNKNFSRLSNMFLFTFPSFLKARCCRFKTSFLSCFHATYFVKCIVIFSPLDKDWILSSNAHFFNT